MDEPRPGSQLAAAFAGAEAAGVEVPEELPELSEEEDEAVSDLAGSLAVPEPPRLSVR